MRDLRLLILSLLVAVTTAACGPTIETRYSYQPPSSSAGLGCVRECEQSRAYCVATSQVSLQVCRADALRRAEYDYRAYLRSLRRGEKPRHSISYYDNSSSCRSDEWRCKAGFNECYAACGGQVTTQRFCTADCDQLSPPVAPYTQVGPTLVNGVAVRQSPQTAARTAKAAAVTRRASSSAEAGRLASRYSISGTNPDDSDYEGTVTVRSDGERYRIRWDIGSEVYHGTGTLSGSRLVIEGRTEGEPFRYDLRVSPDGGLSGNWTTGDDEGRGSEEWSPS